MVCPSCRASSAAEDFFCRRCGTDLSVPSQSLVPVQERLPVVLTASPLPRVAAGVGAVALGVGLELLRRGLLARLAHSGRRSTKALPALISPHLRPLRSSGEKRLTKLPKGYEVQETVVYMQRVIRRGN